MTKLKNSISKLHKLVLTTLLLAITIYGIMELSCNLTERTVSVGNATGRNFTASLHGNGLLTTDVFYDIATWPGFVTNKLTGASGYVFRAGAWGTTSIFLHASDRALAFHLETGS